MDRHNYLSTSHTTNFQNKGDAWACGFLFIYSLSFQLVFSIVRQDNLLSHYNQRHTLHFIERLINMATKKEKKPRRESNTLVPTLKVIYKTKTKQNIYSKILKKIYT